MGFRVSGLGFTVYVTFAILNMRVSLLQFPHPRRVAAHRAGAGAGAHQRAPAAVLQAAGISGSAGPRDGPARRQTGGRSPRGCPPHGRPADPPRGQWLSGGV